MNKFVTLILTLFLSHNVFALGALANDQTINHYGASWNLNSKVKAAKEALIGCSKRGNTNCKIIGYFSNSCVAVARDSKEEGHMISGYALGKSTLFEAKKVAMSKCLNAGGTECLITISVCDGDEYDNGEPYLVGFTKQN